MRSCITLQLLLVAALACGGAEEAADPDVPVRVGIVALDQHNAPVVILEEEGGSRRLPIWIGSAEASSIASEINDHRPPRPNFHDFAKRVIQSVDAEVVRVVVTELRNGTYYANLSLRVRGRLIEIDVRPSDAIAVALRLGAPIMVRESLFEDVGETLRIDDSGQSVDWTPSEPRHPAGTAPATPSLNL